MSAEAEGKCMLYIPGSSSCTQHVRLAQHTVDKEEYVMQDIVAVFCCTYRTLLTSRQKLSFIDECPTGCHCEY